MIRKSAFASLGIYTIHGAGFSLADYIGDLLLSKKDKKWMLDMKKQVEKDKSNLKFRRESLMKEIGSGKWDLK